MRSIILAFLEPTMHASWLAIVKIFHVLFARFWKYLVSLSILFVVQLSTRHISSFIGLTSKSIWKISTILVSYSHTYILYNQYPITILIITSNTYHKFIVLLLLHRLIDNYLSIQEINEPIWGPQTHRWSCIPRSCSPYPCRHCPSSLAFWGSKVLFSKL
jgi:hypothetical protein